MSYKWVNASELAAYQYCRRAWWYGQVEGHSSAHIRRMERGSRYHLRHGRRVRRVPWLRGLAYVLLFTAVAFAVFQLIIGG